MVFILFQRIHEHVLELLHVEAFHDEGFVVLPQQIHVVQHHHAAGVGALQLHRHRHLVRAETPGFNKCISIGNTYMCTYTSIHTLCNF